MLGTKDCEQSNLYSKSNEHNLNEYNIVKLARCLYT